MKILKRRIAEALKNQILRQSLLKHGISRKYADFFIGAQRWPSKTSHYHTTGNGWSEPPIIHDSKRGFARAAQRRKTRPMIDIIPVDWGMAGERDSGPPFATVRIRSGGPSSIHYLGQIVRAKLPQQFP
jgi:hypothetical protein